MSQTGRWIVVTLLLALVLAGCGPAGGSQNTVTISGAWALYPMVVTWAEEYQKTHPAAQFDIAAGGAGKGMTDALAGQVDIGMVSRDVRPEEEQQGAYWIAVTKDAVFPTVSAKNPVLSDLMRRGLTREQLIDIYITGKIETWGQLVDRPEIADDIHVYTRSDAAGAPETWAKYLGNKKQEDLRGIAVYGDPGVIEAVVKDPLGLGYNNLSYAYDAGSGLPVAGAVILPIDANDDGQADADEVLETKREAVQAVASGKYPSPPARALNFVTKGKPTGAVKDFIEWILTDGQQFVDAAGYITLPPEQLAEGLQKLK
jgi:phosphate transport system substrate-binding protein